MKKSIEVRNLSSGYKDELVIKDISLLAKPKEIVGILGPNGSGKTTLLRTLSKILKPKEGVVIIDGKEINKLSQKEIAKKVGVVPQDSAITFSFKAYEIVLMGRNPHLKPFQSETTRDFKVVEEAMRATNTWHLAERAINELSGGEKQRVIIARALAQEPKYLLLDEPTAHLDINQQLEIMDLVKRLSKEKGIGVIAVFHDVNLAARYCENLILMKNGKVYSFGKTGDVLTGENIKEVFGVNAEVRRHSITGFIYVVPVEVSREKNNEKKVRVHVVSGVGTGARLMKLLKDDGYLVTAGVLGIFDDDYEACETLKINVIVESPLSPISKESFKKNLKLIEKSDFVVLTNIPFGTMNLLNLEAVKYAVSVGKKVLVIEESPIKERDFTKGIAAKIYNEIVEKAKVVKSIEECFEEINRYKEAIKLSKNE